MCDKNSKESKVSSIKIEKLARTKKSPYKLYHRKNEENYFEKGEEIKINEETARHATKKLKTENHVFEEFLNGKEISKK